MTKTCTRLGTKSQVLKLEAIIKNAKKFKHTTIKILQDVQEVYGYLPKSILEHISKELNLPLTNLYGVATFYAEFSLSPKGKYPISVCMGTACYVKGAEAIFNKICMLLKIKEGECTTDKLFSIDQTRCVGCCGMAPVLTIGDDVYGNVELKNVETILKKYMEKN